MNFTINFSDGSNIHVEGTDFYGALQEAQKHATETKRILEIYSSDNDSILVGDK